MDETGERLDFIENVALPEAVQRGAPLAGEADWWPSGDSAQIVAGALLAFDESLSGQERADVTNSLLFAQLAADFKYDHFAEAPEWSKTYTKVLEGVGWSLEQFRFGSPVRIDPPVDWAAVVAQAFSGWSGKALAGKAMKAAASLRAGSEALLIWEKNAAQAGQGNFIVQSCWVSNGDLISESAEVIYTLIREPETFLSWLTYYEVQAPATGMSLNENVYAQVRQAIIDKLGDRPKYYVARVPF